MPNHVMYRLRVYGANKDKFHEVFTKFSPFTWDGEPLPTERTPENLFSFNTIIPVPVTMMEEPYSEVGYDWHRNNWGTKWDAYNQSMEVNEDFNEYRFDTAWASPMPVIAAIIEQFPELLIEHFFIEEDCLSGVYVTRGDTVFLEEDFSDRGSWVDAYLNDRGRFEDYDTEEFDQRLYDRAKGIADLYNVNEYFKRQG